MTSELNNFIQESVHCFLFFVIVVSLYTALKICVERVFSLSFVSAIVARVILFLGEFNVDVIQRIKQEEGKTITLDPWKVRWNRFH